MRAVSLWQPWASGIALDLKRIETRGWSTKYRGPLAIHAAKRWAPEQRTFAATQHVQGRLPAAAQLPFGAIVCTAVLVDVVPTHELLATKRVQPVEGLYGDFGPGRFGWLLEDVVALPEPIPFAGKQGFFNVPDTLLPWQPMTTAPKDGTEVELLLRHHNWHYAIGAAKDQWQGPHRAQWIDFNGGGWTWSGMYGKPIAWRQTP